MATKPSKKEIFSIPNILSMFRIVLIPFFIYAYAKAETQTGFWVAAAIILLSGLTDLADGYIARRFNMITELGKLLDPVADKLTQAAILVALTIRYPRFLYLLILQLVREVFMGVNGYILLKKDKKLDGAKWYGKVSTAVFYCATFLLIAFPFMKESLVTLLMVVVAFFILQSFVLYTFEFAKMYKEVKE